MYKIIALLILLALPAWGACPSSWTNGYSHQYTLTVDNLEVVGSANHTDFVVLVDIDQDWAELIANGGFVVDGEDIRFENEAQTQLSHELTEYDGAAAAGIIRAHVLIPVLDFNDDTLFCGYIGKSGVPAGSEEDSGATWTNYAAVLHLNETASPSTSDHYKDSTSNANHGTLTDADANTTSITGQIGNAIDFDGVADFIEVADHATLDITGNLTISVWFRADGTKRNALVTKDTSGARSYALFLGNAADPTFTLSSVFKAGGGESILLNDSTITVDIGEWHYTVMTYDFVIDGTSLSNLDDDGGTVAEGITNAKGDLAITTTALRIGARVYGAFPDYFNGVIDEVRISQETQSSDRIATEHANTFSLTFLTVGAPVAAASGQVFRIQGIIGTIFWRTAWLFDYSF